VRLSVVDALDDAGIPSAALGWKAATLPAVGKSHLSVLQDQIGAAEGVSPFGGASARAVTAASEDLCAAASDRSEETTWRALKGLREDSRGPERPTAKPYPSSGRHGGGHDDSVWDYY
jgi:hypothetical protein